MADEDELELSSDEEGGKKKGKKGGRKTLFLILGAVVVAAAAAGGGVWFLTRGEAPPEPPAQAESAPEAPAPKQAFYMPLDPPFVVNVGGSNSNRFLQVTIEVMARDEKVFDDVKKHMPAIRDALLLLFSSQDIEALGTIEGKQKLRQAVLAEIQRILQEETGSPGIERVYFTSFVTQ
ncbi:flagellar basal body-associated FliL family protein [Inmirania thermothiophila]|uniref:Flagellar protein FliL n=1 Tax=Inmirania thermothiophila TaxID=1750597 RepID=A0A3N1Y841_9GAMM|nr:flagellar basal body-associated FliL family protein [Inmirania thermothiophila]ROR34935.1 flagellar FliL protein [Inmirania thermothiophila]